MKFSEALKSLTEAENIDTAFIRRKAWQDDWFVKLMPDRVYCQHLAVITRFTAMPYYPTQAEMVVWDDWEFGNGQTRDELCKNITDFKKQSKPRKSP